MDRSERGIYFMPLQVSHCRTLEPFNALAIVTLKRPEGRAPEKMNCRAVLQRWYISTMDRAIKIETLYDRIGGRESLAKLLNHFYADVRQHQLIGPIFNKQISDWPEHLELIGSFWTRLTGGLSNYSGNVPGKHVLLGLSPIHFQAWLQLWEFNCRNYLKPPEANEMIGLAHDIGRRLSRLIGTNA